MKTTPTALLALLLSAPVVAQDLPPDVLADKHLLEAAGAIERGDAHGALEALKKVADLEVEPPPMFSWLYGKVLVEHGDGVPAWRRGRSLLARFAVGAGRDSEHYAPALELIVAAEARMEAAERLARIKGRLPEILSEVSAEMVQVEGGTFTMGCTPEQYDCDTDESPVREVRVESFEIGRHEVTQGLWQAVMGENPSAFGDCLRCPVETVGWDDVRAFLQRLNAGGERYRLPSEAEWEYAARGGQLGRGHPHAGSADWTAVAWYYENSGNRPQPVGSRQANELGLFDMSGNVREWVQDCWHASYDDAPGDGRAWEEGDCGRRVIRGGSWYGKPGDVRTANRFWYTTYFRNNNLGFRIARSVGEQE